MNGESKDDWMNQAVQLAGSGPVVLTDVDPATERFLQMSKTMTDAGNFVISGVSEMSKDEVTERIDAVASFALKDIPILTQIDSLPEGFVPLQRQERSYAETGGRLGIKERRIKRKKQRKARKQSRR